MFIVKMADHDGHHRCLKEKNVPIALILPSRLQDGVESLGMETTSCLCQKHYAAHIWQHSIHVRLLGRSGCSSPSTKELHVHSMHILDVGNIQLGIQLVNWIECTIL